MRGQRSLKQPFCGIVLGPQYQENSQGSSAIKGQKEDKFTSCGTKSTGGTWYNKCALLGIPVTTANCSFTSHQDKILTNQ